MKGRVVVAASLTLVVAAVASGQGTSSKWVDRTKADVRAGKASYYEVVDTVLKGEQVAVLQTEETWLNVRTPRGKSGWLVEKALSAKVVEPGGSDFLKHAPGGDASTSATAASMGAKGIYAEEYARSKGYDFSVVRWIEQNQPTAQEVDSFVRSGAGQ
jgi:hypothetical protein